MTVGRAITLEKEPSKFELDGTIIISNFGGSKNIFADCREWIGSFCVGDYKTNIWSNINLKALTNQSLHFK